jgi:hypothetical protein
VLGTLATIYRDAGFFRLCLSPEVVQVRYDPRQKSPIGLIEPGSPNSPLIPSRKTSSQIMPGTDYTARLRQIVEQCRRAARSSFEVEAKGAFRTIGEELSNMADELERSGGSGGRRSPADAPVRTHI